MDACVYFGKDIGKIVRKCVKRWLFLTPNFRTHRNIANLTKKNTQTGVFDFWQGHLCNSRADFIHEILLFGKEVKNFVKNL